MSFSRSRRVRIKATLFTSLWLSVAVASAVEPTLRNLNVRGLQVGGTTTLVIDGDDLGTSPRLLLPFPAKQDIKPGGTDKKATIDVTLANDVPAGYHHLRVVAEGGVSAPVVIGVDRLAQRPLGPSAETLPIAWHGVVAGSATVETKFNGKAKQRVIVEVEAQRLGSKLRPILHLYTPKKLQLTWSWASPTLFGDTRIEAVLPEDGVYSVALHDSEYNAAAGSFFRLKIGEWSYVDTVFPPVVAQGKAQAIELLGMPMPVRMEMPELKIGELAPLPWPKEGAWSGPRPAVSVSPHPEFVEQAAGKMLEIPQGPAGVSGRLTAPHEEDRYRVAVAPGKKVRLEVFAERLGSPLDVAVVVRNEKGDQLARGEDSPGSLDAVLEYTVPDKVNVIVVGVIDAQGRGNSRGVYRLVIEPQDASSTMEGFGLSTTTQRLSLPVAGRAVLPVYADRRGYQGKIDLATALALPMGVMLEGGQISEGADGTLVTITRGDAPFVPAIVTLRGKGSDGSEQSVIQKGHPLARLQPWLATEIALAPANTKSADFLVDWRDLPDSAALVPGSKLVLPIKAARTPPKTTVKLSLLTSQPVVLVNAKPDPNRSLRLEKPLELPVNIDKGDLTVLVPPDLQAASYDLAIQAELLAPDKKVLATAFTPVRKLPVRSPLIVQMDMRRIEAPYDPKKGATVKIAGKIERREGLKADVAVTVVGLPAGAKADTATLKPGTSDFTVSVVLPPNLPAAEITGAKVSASAAPDPKQPNLRVRAREIEVTLVLKAPGK